MPESNKRPKHSEIDRQFSTTLRMVPRGDAVVVDDKIIIWLQSRAKTGSLRFAICHARNDSVIIRGVSGRDRIISQSEDRPGFRTDTTDTKGTVFVGDRYSLALLPQRENGYNLARFISVISASPITAREVSKNMRFTDYLWNLNLPQAK